MIFSENSKVQTLGDWFFVTLRNKYLMLTYCAKMIFEEPFSVKHYKQIV